MSNQTWASVAQSLRQTLHELGYRVELGCLPGEAHPCGGTDNEHVAVYLAALRAVADHQLEHLGAPPDLIASAYANTLADLRAVADHQLEHLRSDAGRRDG